MSFKDRIHERGNAYASNIVTALPLILFIIASLLTGYVLMNGPIGETHPKTIESKQMVAVGGVDGTTYQYEEFPEEAQDVISDAIQHGEVGKPQNLNFPDRFYQADAYVIKDGKTYLIDIDVNALYGMQFFFFPFIGLVSGFIVAEQFS